LIVIPQLHDIHWARGNCNFYNGFIRRANEILPTIDLMENFASLNDFGELYTDDDYGGHLLPKGNELVYRAVLEKLKTQCPQRFC